MMIDSRALVLEDGAIADVRRSDIHYDFSVHGERNVSTERTAEITDRPTAHKGGL